MNEKMDEAKARNIIELDKLNIGIQFPVNTPVQGAYYYIEAIEKAESLEGMLKWIAQTIHQAHHQDRDGTWETCRKHTCDGIKKTLDQWKKEK